VQAGPSLRQLYGIGLYGVDFGVAIGADIRRLGVHAVVEGFAGTTGFGLTTGQLRAGVSVEGHVDRLRFGGGPLIGAMWMKRVTRGTNIQDLTIGPEIHLTVDVIRFGEHAQSGRKTHIAHRILDVAHDQSLPGVIDRGTL
jgi:hypothetical protein